MQIAERPEPALPLARYLQHGMAHVEGWLWPTTAAITAFLLTAQQDEGQHGDVCEIGVHHGKYFLLLANAAGSAERAVAVDVFGDQQKNLDASGCGDRTIFEANIARFAPAAATEIIQQSSLELEGLGFCTYKFRFFSVDGGHTAEATLNDLWLAERTLLPSGIVALDDVMNTSWTGVVSGLAAYYAAGGALIPFALVPNKLLLTTAPHAAERYRALLRHHFPQAIAKPDQEFFSAIIDTYHDHPYYNHEAHAGLHRQLEDLQAEKTAAAAKLSAAQAAQAALEHRLAGQDAACTSLRAELTALQAERNWLHSVMHSLEHEKAAAEEAALARSLATQARERALSQQLEQATSLLSALRASTSWRITATMRAARRVLTPKPR